MTVVIEFEPIDMLGLPRRVENLLRSEGIAFVNDLCERTEADLLKMPRAGKRAIVEIRTALAQRGLALRSRDEWR